jgi:hypothetical protein
MKREWAEGFSPKYQQLDVEQSKILIQTGMMELKVGNKEFIPKNEYPLLLQIVMKRIEVMELPIKFNDCAKMLLITFTDNPGKAIVFLIDALNMFEGKEVTVDMICQELYPWGFYTYESFCDYVDNFIRPHKVKWAGVYCGKPEEKNKSVRTE